MQFLLSGALDALNVYAAAHGGTAMWALGLAADCAAARNGPFFRRGTQIHLKAQPAGQSECRRLLPVWTPGNRRIFLQENAPVYALPGTPSTEGLEEYLRNHLIPVRRDGKPLPDGRVEITVPQGSFRPPQGRCFRISSSRIREFGVEGALLAAARHCLRHGGQVLLKPQLGVLHAVTLPTSVRILPAGPQELCVIAVC